MRYLHFVNNNKIIDSYIDFMKKHFREDTHFYIYLDDLPEGPFPVQEKDNVMKIDYELTGRRSIFKLSKKLNAYMDQADKVIFHGLFFNVTIDYLYLNQRYLKKCYWAMWGGDLYAPMLSKKTINNFFENYKKRQIIRKFGGLITYIKGDYELAQKWYGAKGKYHECFMYPSNLYKEYDIKQKEYDTVNIQVGNSADPTNNHIEVFKKLEKYKDNDIKIVVPLSYGNQEYAKEVIEQGKKIFGDKFEPLTEFIPFDQYLDLLAEIDIAIFNHNRQQAMGNIITLLGLGKKVYIRNDITPWNMFEDVEIDVFDVSNVTLDLLDEETKQQNQKRVKEYFSEENYLKQLINLLGE